MALPDVTLTIEDGALGIIGASTDNVHVKLGVSSKGTFNALVSLSDKKTLSTTFGTGPLVDSTALALDTAGGPVICVRVKTSTAGTIGAVTHTGTGHSVLTVQGTPTDQFDIEVDITRNAGNLAANAAAFEYSLDGGNSLSPEIAVPTNGRYPIPGTGLTLVFSNGTFVKDDVYTLLTRAPTFSLADLTTAINAVLASPLTWSFLHVVGPPSNVAAAASLLASLDTFMSSAEVSFRYAFALMECPNDTDAHIIGAFANSASKRVCVTAGYAEIVSTMSGLIRKRSAAWPIAARIAQVPIHEDLGRVATGPIVGVASLDRDEQATPGLDEERFATLRTIIGEQGYWITAGKLMSPWGSDFVDVQHRRVMDKACALARSALLHFLNDTVRVDSTTGAIREKDARAIEAYVDGIVRAALVAPGHASDISIHVDRNANILSTQTLPVTIRVTPLGYNHFISVDIGFTNPALQVTAVGA